MRRQVVAFVGLSFLLALSATSARAAGRDEGLSPAAQTLARCVQTSNSLSVVLLVDQSGSLRTTDRAAQRVDGLRAVLTGLSRLADTPVGGRKPTVDVLFSGFSWRVQPKAGEANDAWQQVTPQNLDGLIRQAGGYARRNYERDTDYGTALLASRRFLSQHTAKQTAAGKVAPCKALIWFTDGKFAIADRIGPKADGLPTSVEYAPDVRLDRPGGGEKAVEAGRQTLCRDGGLMDGLENDGVVKFTVGLASADLAGTDSRFLDAVTTGGAGGAGCGSTLTRSTGEYLQARDADALFFTFGALFAGQAPLGPAVSVCPTKPCPSGSVTFDVAPAIRRFVIRAATGTDGVALDLAGPSGGSERLQVGGPTRLAVSGAAITQRWVSSKAVEVQGDLPARDVGADARWTMAFVDPDGTVPDIPPRYAIQLFTELAPELQGRRVAYRGAPTRVRFVLRSPSGATGEGGDFARAAKLKASWTDPRTGKTTAVPLQGPGSDGAYVGTLDLPAQFVSSYIDIDAEATFPQQEAATVAPQQRSFRLSVRLPPGQGYPSVSPDSLPLGSIEGKGSTSAYLVITGSPVGPGCAWLGAPKINAPNGAGEVRFGASPDARNRDRCIKVAARERRTIQVTFTTTKGATGTARGSVPVTLTSELTAGARTVSVEARFELLPQQDVAKRVAIIVLLGLVGALFPLAVLWLLNLSGAKFTAPERLLVWAADVTIDPAGQLVATSDGKPLPVPGSAFEPLGTGAIARKVRDLEVDEFDLVAKATGGPGYRPLRRLFSGPFGIATAAGRYVVAGSPLPLKSWKDGIEHEVPLTLPLTWLFAAEPSDPVTTVADDPVDFDFGFGGGSPLAASTKPDEKRRQGRLVLILADTAEVGAGERLLAEAAVALSAHEFPGNRPDGGNADNNGAPTSDDGPPGRVQDDSPKPWSGDKIDL